MSSLYVVFLAQFDGGGRLRWPNPDGDPARSDPVMLDAELDFWKGDELLDFADPWFLITANAWQSVRMAGLVGLHTVPLPTLRFSELGAVRAALGEFAVRRLPAFCIARPIGSVRIANQLGEEDPWTLGDELLFWDWSGDDFARSRLGLVVSEQARAVLLRHHIPNSTFLHLSQR
jgi:hypothetical protein